eukprot:PhM_4_TR4804/c0_g2_i1/m.41153
MRYTISPKAYHTAVLHAMRHHTETVVGVFLGRHHDTAGLVEVLDCVPVLHSNTALKPLLEVACLQIKNVEADSGLTIVGAYAANERLGDNTPNESARNAVINQHCRDYGLFVQINNTELRDTAPAKATLCGKAYARDGAAGQWGDVPEGLSLMWSAGDGRDNNNGGGCDLSSLTRHIEQRAFERIVDFEDFTEDPTLDYTNPGLVA